uniref:Uncharacterized protein n=1 Tax=Nelumbo nucifera TaxID=4432 RepID=A0A822Z160_NELNU|nr:TPA_asm: hypothetical protein HUJ06_014457 [Nelumbo nucifera]
MVVTFAIWLSKCFCFPEEKQLQSVGFFRTPIDRFVKYNKLRKANTRRTENQS